MDISESSNNFSIEISLIDFICNHYLYHDKLLLSCNILFEVDERPFEVDATCSFRQNLDKKTCCTK